MSSGEKTIAPSPRGRQLIGELARVHGADGGSRSTPGVVCQQGQDWSRGTVCIPQKFVRLIGHRDPASRPSSPLGTRVLTAPSRRAPTDTPIG